MSLFENEKLMKPGKWYSEFDEKGNVAKVVYDESFRRLLGYKNESDFSDSNEAWTMSIHPDDIDRVESYVAETCAKHPEGMDYDIEYRMMTANGYRWFHDYAHAVRSEDGSVIRTDGVVFDIQDIVEKVDEHKLLTDNYSRIFALEDNFESLYDVELNSGRYEEYNRGEFYQNNVMDRLISSSNFFENMHENIDMVVWEEDRESTYFVQQKENIVKGLTEKDHIDHYYRIVTKADPVWLKMRIVYKDASKTNVIIGVFNAEEEMASRLKEEKLRNEMAENYARILALEDNFEVLYDVELETGKYDIFVKGQTFGDVNNNLINNNSFFDDVECNLNVVHPEDRQGNLETTRPEFIRRVLAEDDHFDRYYRLMVDGKPAWARMRIVYKNAEKKNIIIGVFNAGNDVEAKQIAEQKEMLETQQKQLKEQLALLDGLAREYHTVWIIDSTGEHRMHLYRTTGKKTIQSAVQIALDDPSYDPGIIKYVNDYVHEDDRERVLEATNFETIERETPEVGTYVVSYRRYNPEHTSYDYHQMVYARAESADGRRNYIFAYRDADKMLREEIDRQNRLKDALESANIETKRNDVLTKIISGSRFTYDISADDELTDAHYSQVSIDRVGEEYTRTPLGWIELLHPEDKERVYSDFMASINDHTGETLYNVTFRMMGRNGKYRWVRSGGNAIRRLDGTGEFFGISIDITDQMEEQQKRILGAMPLSNDVLTKANIGLWAFELDEGMPPRMYVDDAMLGLIGLKEQVPPEETYHAWYDNIDEGSYDLVEDAVAKMSSGEHAEVQYPWHNPDGRTIVVRCGGVRNYEYAKGIRIEGTHQDVTQTLHYDEEERKRAKQLENDLIISKLRADSLAYISDNEPDLDNAINFFGQRILEISGCDQVIFRELDGRCIVRNAPGINDVSPEICAQCPFSDIKNEVFGEDGIVLMNDCAKGCRGVVTNPSCPAKSSYMQRVYSSGELVGQFAVHYLNNYNTFSENEVSIMKMVAVYLGLMIGRIKEKQANIARIEAESSNKAKTEFLFNMSHDIRTPMNAILGYTNIALNHANDAVRVSDSLNKIKTSGGHLLNLINDILEMSRIEAGRLEIASSPLSIYEVTEGVISMSQALAATKDITFNAKISDLNNPYILADELHINQVVINLISNAIKYTHPGGTVDYSIEQISDPVDGIAKYRATVKDNGIGMSEDFQKHLFESFAREQTATVSKQEGAGLGLAIVKKILDMTGGTIEVNSTRGVGSTVIVELPFEVMDDEAIAEFKASHGAEEDDTVEITLKGKRVLLVEDNELNREIAVDILGDEGLIVEEAKDGTVAVDILREKGPENYDFVLMDIQMPIMNGYEATKIIRAMYPDSKLPIIALSANAFAEDREKSFAAGMDGHVAKPINVDELFGVLSKLV